MHKSHEEVMPDLMDTVFFLIQALLFYMLYIIFDVLGADRGTVLLSDILLGAVVLMSLLRVLRRRQLKKQYGRHNVIPQGLDWQFIFFVFISIVFVCFIFSAWVDMF